MFELHSTSLPWIRSLFFLFFISGTTQPCLFADLKDKLQPLIDAHAGEVTVSIKNLKTGESFEFNSTKVMPTASLIKFPILVELYRQIDAGKISKETIVTLKEEDKVPGSGILTSHFPAGTQLPIEGAARLMIAYSDNTATNLVLDQTGIQAVVDTMIQMGFGETRINAKVFRRDLSIALERSEKYGLGSTTAADMVALLEKLYRKELVSQSASEIMLKHLAACDDRSKLLRFLPKSIKAFHKTGAVANVRTDAGLLESPSATLAIAVLTNNNKDASWGDENAAEILIGKIAQNAFEHFSTSERDVSPKESERLLQFGATGEFVEGLQRTLNLKLRDAPKLTVDGDFGALTEAAVKRFQQQEKLKETGLVDADTWKALGPLQLEAEPIPPPAEVNSQTLERKPRDPIDGQPFVSAKAWSIVDGKTGKTLAHHKEHEPLDIASTTKIMTAWLVIQECDRDPKVLDELVVFSKRADNTVGSSATIRAGEQVSVGELLYGLMLPSGNDASVAFGEHFGTRLAKRAGQEGAGDPLPLFIDAMNREANKLGLKETFYENTSGLTSEKHKSSCADLIQLARQAMTSDLFRKVVSTRQRGAQVVSRDGYTRNLLWKNTNPLLGTEGYIGIKTGTTDAAGACLVSCSENDGQRLYVVILGSSGSPAREADSRNLHRWGWTLLR